MNLIGLILIAALSGGIVVVSLRLRADPSSLRLDREHLNENDRLPRDNQKRFRDPAAPKAEKGIYRAVRSLIAEARSLF